jgi:hypothetical protein
VNTVAIELWLARRSSNDSLHHFVALESSKHQRKRCLALLVIQAMKLDRQLERDIQSHHMVASLDDLPLLLDLSSRLGIGFVWQCI